MTLDHVLKKEYHGHDVYFWCALQNMHDDGSYWNDGAITDEGEAKLVELKERYS